jgi:hypothetical protein
MRRFVLILTAIVLLMAALVLAASQEVDLAGTWKGATAVPSGETDELTLILEKLPDGYKGKISDSVGMVTEAEVYNFAFKEGKLTFNFSLNDGAEISIEMTLTEGKLVGFWSHPEGSSGSVELIRQ